MKPVIRRAGIYVLPYLWNGYNGLWVNMVALKTEASVRDWRQNHHPQMVTSIRDYMYRHLYEGRELRTGEKKQFVFFAERGAA